MTYVWAYVAGTLTLINPCVLPLLPIIIAAAFQSSRLGPLMLAVGLTLSFAVIGVGVTAFGHLAGIDDGLINRVAAVVMVAFGVILLVPRAQALLARIASPLASRANIGIDRVQGAGAAGQLAVGVLLGVSRASQAMHRVGLALIIPVGIVIAAVLMISGLGVVLLTFADLTWECTGAGEALHCEADEVINSVRELYAVVGALLMAFAILGVATWLARRAPQSQTEES